MKRITAVSIVFALISATALLNAAGTPLKYNLDWDIDNVDASFHGILQMEASGWDCAMAGDINGDGYEDILIGAWENNEGGSEAGKVYLVLGAGDYYKYNESLANANGSFSSESAGDRLGQSVAGAGDVNGDGYDDIIFSAEGNDDGGQDAGKTYLFFGKSGDVWTGNMDPAGADVQFIGEAAGDHSGVSVAGAGDVNGDGFDDILIGACNQSQPNTDAGKAYLFFGRPDNQWNLTYDLGESNASFVGETSYDAFGNIVAPAGDVNNDDYDDFLIGAVHDSEDGGSQCGQTYLFLGRPNTWSNNQSANSANGSFIGESSMDHSGSWADGAGDVNGDGYDDILIGARYFDVTGSEYGRTYLIFGKAGTWSKNQDLSGADVMFRGEMPSDKLGICVSGAGDVNGDGIDDMIMGASGWSSGKGQAYLILGKSSGWTTGRVDLYSDASFLGITNWDQAGFRLDGGGDFNGDGFDDILIGAPYYNGAEINRGHTYVVHPADNYVPTSVTSVTAFSDAGYSTQAFNTELDTEIYIELVGIDQWGLTPDTALVRVNSSSYPVGFDVRLKETGASTGVYRGSFTVKQHTDKSRNWIGGVPWDKVWATSVQDASKSALVNITSGAEILPLQSVFNADEDSYFEQLLTTNVPDAAWTLESVPSWLNWNSVNHTMWGVPTNADVGNHSLNAIVKDGTNKVVAQKPFTIRVFNTVPQIIGTFNSTAVEDVPYYVDLNSTDDGQGIITWTLFSDALVWLSLDNDTGELSGTPNQTHAGSYYVDVLVNDGNGGSQFQSYNLDVAGVNDPPSLSGTPAGIATEDEMYIFQFEVQDEDDSVFSWNLYSDAEFLTLYLGNISGIPLNKDVGSYFVNVTVTDSGGLKDSFNYTLDVFNTNDLPELVDFPKDITIDLGDTYTGYVNAVDIDVGDVVTYSIASIPETDISIDGKTGNISWVPDQVGTFNVTITISDSHSSLFHSFTIEVASGLINNPPYFSTNPVLEASVGLEWTYSPKASDNDGDTTLISLVQAPAGMAISSGTITWTPTVVGNFTVKLEVTDGKETITQEFTVRVYPEGQGPGQPNRAPTITPIETQVAIAGEPFFYQIQASDPDGDDLVFTLLDGPLGLMVSEDGMVSWTPTPFDEGRDHTVRVQVTDGEYQDTEEFNINVQGNATGGAGVCITVLIFLLLAPILIIILIVIVVVAVRKKKKEPEAAGTGTAQPRAVHQEPQPDVEADSSPGYTLSSPDAIEAEVATSDIFTQRERDRGAVEALKAGGKSAKAEPMILDHDDPMLMDEPDMPEEIVDEPPGLISENPPEILGDALFDSGPEPPAGVSRPPLALPPARILDVQEDPMSTSEFSEVLIMTREGLLLNHYAKDPSSEIDHDILSGMLSAVQAFVKDSFKNLDSTLKRLEMAEFTVLIEPGRNLTAVGITKDRENRELGDQLLKMMRDVDSNMSDQFKNWDGDLDDIREVEVYIQKLLEGGYE